MILTINTNDPANNILTVVNPVGLFILSIPFSKPFSYLTCKDPTKISHEECKKSSNTIDNYLSQEFGSVSISQYDDTYNNIKYYQQEYAT